MPELVTPVQYEPMLDGLNVVRPLKFDDKVKVALSSSIGCVNLPSETRPAKGKFLRCDNQGSLLKRLNSDYRQTDVQTLARGTGITYSVVTFTQFCYGAITWVELLGGLVSYVWATPVLHSWIQEFSNTDVNYFPFRGYNCVIGIGNAGAICRIKIQGIY